MVDEELLSAISKMMDERFDAFGRQVDQKLDKRFDEFGRQVDQRFDAFGKQVDQRFDAVRERMDYLEFKIDHTLKNLDDLKLDMQIMNRDLRRDYHQLNDTLETVVEILQTHELIPR